MATRKEVISVSDNLSFRLIVDVLNEVFHLGYEKWSIGNYFSKTEQDGRYIWFPKFSRPEFYSANGQPVIKEWDNSFFDKEKKYICERRVLTKEEAATKTKICKGNPSHYNNPLDCINNRQPVPSLTSEKCKFSIDIDYSFERHNRITAVFGKVGNYYRFFGIYEFIGVQTEKYEKIEQNNPYTIKDKYINIYKRTNSELKISEWL